MPHGEYEYEIQVSATPSIIGGGSTFVAAVIDLRRRRADGTVERLATPFGQYHGADAAEAESRAREAVARWIAANRGR
jgi:hypothetical protein